MVDANIKNLLASFVYYIFTSEPTSPPQSSPTSSTFTSPPLSNFLYSYTVNYQTKGIQTQDHSGMISIKSPTVIQWKWQTDSRDKVWETSAWITMNRGSWHCTDVTWRQRSRPSPRKKKKKCKKAKWLSKEALQIAEKRREAKGKREKERYTHLNGEF